MRSLKDKYDKFLIKIKSKNLKNKNFSLIANNCIGGVIYHSLGEKFNSPTINLFMKVEDYFVFLENLDLALKSELIEDVEKKKEYTYPVGKLFIGGGYINIYFVHYRSFEDAKIKWDERCKRVNKDNLFVIMEGGIETSDEMVERFGRLKFKNKILLTNKKYDFDFTYYMSFYNKNFYWGKALKRTVLSLYSRRYLDKFNYVKWINGNIIKK